MKYKMFTLGKWWYSDKAEFFPNGKTGKLVFDNGDYIAGGIILESDD